MTSKEQKAEPEDERDEQEERPRKKFCLSCGATHFKEICPECGSDAQDDL